MLLGKNVRVGPFFGKNVHMGLEYKLLVSQNQFVLRHFFPRNIVLFNKVIYFKAVYSKCTWDKALCGGEGEEVQSTNAGSRSDPTLDRLSGLLGKVLHK